MPRCSRPESLRWAFAASSRPSVLRGGDRSKEALRTAMARLRAVMRDEALKDEANEDHYDVAGVTSLVDCARACLKAAAAAAEESQSADGRGTGKEEVAECCMLVRSLLHVRAVRRVLREFLGSLLYLVLSSAPQLQDAHTWSARHRLVTFLHQLCGGKATMVNIWRHRHCCPECVARHVACQEALSLVRFFRDHKGKAEISYLLEDGFYLLLQVISDLVSSLHPLCFASSGGSGPLGWSDLHRDLAKNARSNANSLLDPDGSFARWLLEVSSQIEDLKQQAAACEAPSKDGSADGREMRFGEAFAEFRDFPHRRPLSLAA